MERKGASARRPSVGVGKGSDSGFERTPPAFKVRLNLHDGNADRLYPDMVQEGAEGWQVGLCQDLRMTLINRDRTAEVQVFISRLRNNFHAVALIIREGEKIQVRDMTSGYFCGEGDADVGIEQIEQWLNDFRIR